MGFRDADGGGNRRVGRYGNRSEIIQLRRFLGEGFDAEDGCEEEIEDGDSADAPSGSEGGDSGSEVGAGDGDF